MKPELTIAVAAWAFCLLLVVMARLTGAAAGSDTEEYTPDPAPGKAVVVAQDDISAVPVEETVGDALAEDELIEAALVEQGYYREDVPLTYLEQDFLHTACAEAGIPYELALAVIEQETQFRNVTGDDGDSIGYMQIQPRWHAARMERLGVTDLTDPYSNFRVGCDFLAELLDSYYSIEAALVVYNQGHYNGYTTEYAQSVINNMEKWRDSNA